MNEKQMNKFLKRWNSGPPHIDMQCLPILPQGGGLQKPPAKWGNIDILTGFPISLAVIGKKMTSCPFMYRF